MLHLLKSSWPRYQIWGRIKCVAPVCLSLTRSHEPPWVTWALQRSSYPVWLMNECRTTTAISYIFHQSDGVCVCVCVYSICCKLLQSHMQLAAISLRRGNVNQLPPSSPPSSSADNTGAIVPPNTHTRTPTFSLYSISSPYHSFQSHIDIFSQLRPRSL